MSNKIPDPYYIENSGYVTSTKCKVFRKCPACFAAIEQGFEPEGNEGMEFGIMMHKIMEKGVGWFKDNYEILEPRKKKTSYDGDKIPLTNSEGEKVMEILDEVARHPVFDTDGKYDVEEVLTGKYKDTIPLRARLDRISEEKLLIRDWKFVADPEKFEWSIKDYDYIFSFAFYWILAKQVYGKEFRMIFDVIGTSKKGARSIEIPQEYIKEQIPIVRETLDDILACLKTDTFFQLAEKQGYCTPSNPAYSVCPNAIRKDFELFTNL